MYTKPQTLGFLGFLVGWDPEKSCMNWIRMRRLLIFDNVPHDLNRNEAQMNLFPCVLWRLWDIASDGVKR